MSAEQDAFGGASRSVTIAMDRRLRTVSPRDLPLVPRAVLRAVAGRAEEHGLAWPNLETIAYEAGTTPNTARRALDELIRLGWLTVTMQATPRRSATYRINLDPVVPGEGITERYPRGAAPRDHGAGSQGSRSDVPGITELDPRGAVPRSRDHGATPEDHREDPIEDHREDPIALSREHHQRGQGHVQRPGQIALSLDPSGPPDLPATSKASTATDPPKAPKVKPDLPIAALSDLERAVHEAIVSDESLAPIVRDPARWARELVKLGPGVNVPHAVRMAGAWLRANPKRAKKNGAAFLSTWIGNEQERASRRPEPRAGAPFTPARRGPIELPGTVGPERPRPIPPPPVPESVRRGVEAQIAAGLPVPTLEDIRRNLARVGRRLPPDPVEAT